MQRSLFPQGMAITMLLLLSSLLLVACSKTGTPLPPTPSIRIVESPTQDRQIPPPTGAVVTKSVSGWAVLAQKEDYSDVGWLGLEDLKTGFIDISQLHWLLTYSGWREDHILELRDNFGQKEIIEAVWWLASKSAPQDVVIFYYNGHATYLREVIRWEEFFAAEWERVPSQRRILVVDSCYAAEFTQVLEDNARPFLSIASVGEDQTLWGGLWDEGLPILGSVFRHYFVMSLLDPTADFDGDGAVSVQEAALQTDPLQREYMHTVVWADARFAWREGTPPTDYPSVVLDDRLGYPIYLDLELNLEISMEEVTPESDLAKGESKDTASFLKDGERIAFMSERGGKLDIYSMKIDGSDVIQLTDHPGVSGLPSWHPAGNKIVYITKSGVTARLNLIDPTGRISSLTNTPGGQPDWSSDGKSVAFVGGTPGQMDLFVLDVETQEVFRLTDDSVSNISPSWSPENQQIAFMSNRDGNWDIYIIEVHDLEITRIIEGEVDNFVPAWSPDGGSIAFASDRDGDLDIYVLHLSSGEISRLTDNDSNNTEPTWSPGGERIAFASDRDGNWEIYVMKADGSEQARLTDDPSDDLSPAWSPAP
jgi:Tol biopolymer transport system component